MCKVSHLFKKIEKTRIGEGGKTHGSEVTTVTDRATHNMKMMTTVIILVVISMRSIIHRLACEQRSGGYR